MSSLAAPPPRNEVPDNIGTGAPFVLTFGPSVILQWLQVACDQSNEWMMLFDATSTPVVGQFPKVVFDLSKDEHENYMSFLPNGMLFRQGLSFGVSSTLQTFTPTLTPLLYNVSLQKIFHP